MATRARRHTVFMTVMALWYVGTPASAAAQDARVTLRVRNDAQVPGVLLTDAKARVAAIYAKAGIDATFVDARPDFTIVLLSRHTADNMRRIPDAVGFAPRSETARGHIAYVMQPRVDRIAEGYRTPRAIVLAVAVAHEVGHLLMFNSHSSTGTGVRMETTGAQAGGQRQPAISAGAKRLTCGRDCSSAQFRRSVLLSVLVLSSRASTTPAPLSSRA